MGLSLKDIQTNRKTITIDLTQFGFEGVEPLEVTFKTNFWSTRDQKVYLEDESGKEKKIPDGTIDTLVNAITDWNLTDDGVKVPITREVLEGLNFVLLDGILADMIKAVYPNRKSSAS